MLNQQLEARLRDAPPLLVIDLRGEMTTFAQEPLALAYQEASNRGATKILLNFGEVDLPEQCRLGGRHRHHQSGTQGESAIS